LKIYRNKEKKNNIYCLLITSTCKEDIKTLMDSKQLLNNLNGYFFNQFDELQ